MVDTVVTSVVRLSFANLFKPQKNQMDPEKEPRFSTVGLFPVPSTLTGEDLAEYNAAMQGLKTLAFNAAAGKWGADKIPKNLRSPFNNQGDKDYDGFEDGAIYISPWASADKRPKVVDQNVQEILQSERIYSGCYARLLVNAFAYGGVGTTFTPGVQFGLQAVQLVREGDPLGGLNIKAADHFKPLGGSTPVPVAGGPVDPMDIFK